MRGSSGPRHDERLLALGVDLAQGLLERVARLERSAEVGDVAREDRWRCPQVLAQGIAQADSSDAKVRVALAANGGTRRSGRSATECTGSDIRVERWCHATDRPRSMLRSLRCGAIERRTRRSSRTRAVAASASGWCATCRSNIDAIGDRLEPFGGNGERDGEARANLERVSGSRRALRPPPDETSRLFDAAQTIVGRDRRTPR